MLRGFPVAHDRFCLVDMPCVKRMKNSRHDWFVVSGQRKKKVDQFTRCRPAGLATDYTHSIKFNCETNKRIEWYRLVLSKHSLQSPFLQSASEPKGRLCCPSGDRHRDQDCITVGDCLIVGLHSQMLSWGQLVAEAAWGCSAHLCSYPLKLEIYIRQIVPIADYEPR